MNQLSRFDSVWLIDFEFTAGDGECPKPICMVGREFKSGRLIRIFEDDLRAAIASPIPLDNRSLYVAYFASAELGCHLSLEWKIPRRVLDLFVEFRNLTNGIRPANGYGLLGALNYFGLDSIDVAEKEAMRQLAMRGAPYTKNEQLSLLDYCQTDVDALARLLPAMINHVDLPRALLRGRYMAAIAQMEATGTPIDVDNLSSFRNHWGSIKRSLVSEVDRDFGVYDGLTFKQDLFGALLKRKGMPWPRTANNRLALDRETFRQQSRKYPIITPLHELRQTLSELRLEKLTIGNDGRNRCLLSPFSSRTGRNQPSNNKFIFGLPAWNRGLIKPEMGQAIAYIDWSQQELGIGAALSNDQNMLAAYLSGDPYLEFAKQASAVPDHATKQSHPNERELFKVCALAVQYEMGEHRLAESLGQPVAFARNLLLMHRETYRKYWSWSQNNIDHAMLAGWSQTVFGWRIHTTNEANPRSLANFPMQANGAEMLRLACCLTTESGIRVCCPVHDAILIQAPIDSIEEVVRESRRYMAEASRIVLNGFELATDAKIVQYPDRFFDGGRGRQMWDRVFALCQSAASPTRMMEQRNVINDVKKPSLIATRTVL